MRCRRVVSCQREGFGETGNPKLHQQSLTPELKQLIYNGFRRHALAETGHDGLEEPVTFVAEVEGEIVAAVVVRLFWGALHIKYVWTHEDWRLKGLAKQLMEQALQFGRQAAAPFAFVETLSFQAREFYQRLGFELEYTRNGYAQGVAAHYLRKDLN
jgi:ribosomal protein S18 acetylase RimI-like enzyme